jgi:nitrogenase subunit NifH
MGKTVVEGCPDSALAAIYGELADTILRMSSDIEGGMRSV